MDIFDIAEALIKLRKLYNLPVIDIYGKKETNVHHFGECSLNKKPYPNIIETRAICLLKDSCLVKSEDRLITF